jgi:hypothetical protein
MPRAMMIAPLLDDRIPVQAITPRAALLINPFCPKGPHAGFGKHVLTSTLALTSIAGTRHTHYSAESSSIDARSN